MPLSMESRTRDSPTSTRGSAWRCLIVHHAQLNHDGIATRSTARLRVKGAVTQVYDEGELEKLLVGLVLKNKERRSTGVVRR